MAQDHPAGYVPKVGVEVAAFWFLLVCPFNHYTKPGLSLAQKEFQIVLLLLHLSLISCYSFINVFLSKNTIQGHWKGS